jgi:heme A synthase
VRPDVAQEIATSVSGGDAMDAFFEIVSVRTFWRLLLFLHFTSAVTLLALVTFQAVTVLIPARQMAGNVDVRLKMTPSASVARWIVILYLPTFLLGAWVYIKYRTYVRIPMEQLSHWWTVGSFEVKEHILSLGMALLPAYWYFWRDPLRAEHDAMRKALTLLLAFAVWYGFLVGHTANDFRGVGS